MHNPFVAAVLAMALAAQMQRGTFYEQSGGKRRTRSKGKPGKPGDKLNRMASEARIGIVLR